MELVRDATPSVHSLAICQNSSQSFCSSYIHISNIKNTINYVCNKVVNADKNNKQYPLQLKATYMYIGLPRESITKQDILLLPVTSPNVDRFVNLCHYRAQQYTCNETIITAGCPLFFNTDFPYDFP